MLTITRAAILMPDGIVFSVPQPGRHQHCIWTMLITGNYDLSRDYKQGFLTSEGAFVDRYTARAIATEAGQLLPRDQGKAALYSEDVWEGWYPDEGALIDTMKQAGII